MKIGIYISWDYKILKIKNGDFSQPINLHVTSLSYRLTNDNAHYIKIFFWWHISNECTDDSEAHKHITDALHNSKLSHGGLTFHHYIISQDFWQYYYPVIASVLALDKAIYLGEVVGKFISGLQELLIDPGLLEVHL